jgi:signal transduction histidine kinase
LQSAFAVGGLVLLVTVVGAGVLHGHHVALPPDRSQRLLDLARTTNMMAAAAAFTVCLIRWQQSAESAVSLIGTAVLAFGLGVVGTSGLLLPIIDANSPLVSAARAASLVVVFVALVAALVWPPVDTRLTPLRLAGGALVVAAVLTTALDRLPRLADLLAFGHRSLEGIPVPSPGGRVALSAVWALLALILAAQGLRRGRALLAWAGLMLFALALAELSAMAAKSANDLWLLAGIVMQTLAMVFVLVGLADELRRTYLDQRARLFDTQIAMETVAAKGRLVGEGTGRRRHDVGNALMAIQGAARTLEREHDRLSEDNRRRMAEMLGSSVQRLHRLVGEDPTAPGAFPLAEPVDAALSPLRTAGVALEVSVPDGLRVVGVRTAATEALRRVGDAVWAARPREAVEVIGVALGGEVWLSVVFEPSAPRAMRLLGRLRREPRVDSLGYWGDGATLTVAARLVQDMGGGLTAEPDGETRLAFRLTLPAAPPE